MESIINRYYDPATDEFMSIDPDVATTDQPYVFTNDDPLNAEDPLGENIWSTIAKGVAIVLGITAIIVVVVVVVVSGDEGGSASEDGVQIIKDGNGNDSGGSSASGGDHGTFSLNFSDPSTPPGEDWTWKGNGPKDSSQGNWVNEDTGAQLHPDLAHGDPIGPHYYYKAPDGSRYRIFPDGKIAPK